MCQDCQALKMVHMTWVKVLHSEMNLIICNKYFVDSRIAVSPDVMDPSGETCLAVYKIFVG